MISREKASNLFRLAMLMLINLCIVCLAFFHTSPLPSSQPAVDVLSQYGSRGEEVSKIQTRLKSWGYFSGEVTGYYGSQTTEAVKRFQKKHGLSATGVADQKTLALIGISSSSSGASVSNADLELLARIISAEARGEPYIGQVAVGAVVLNRVESSSFPDSISGVIYQPGAFDAVEDKQFYLTPNETALNAARDALNGWDPTNGALYYWNPVTATSRWIWSIPITTTIGRHVFGVK